MKQALKSQTYSTSSCPLLEGYAVYQARALWSIWHPEHHFDDVEICESAGYYKSEGEIEKAESKEKARLWYDKKIEKGIVFYHFENEGRGSIEVYSLVGTVVAKQNLEAGVNISLVDLSKLSAGEYIYRIKSESGLVVTNKFIIY